MYRYHSIPRLPTIDLSLHEMGDPWRDHLGRALRVGPSYFADRVSERFNSGGIQKREPSELDSPGSQWDGN